MKHVVEYSLSMCELVFFVGKPSNLPVKEVQ